MPFFITQAEKAETGERPKIDDDWRAFLDTVPAMVWLSDAQGRLLYVNEAWRTTTGLDLKTFHLVDVWTLVFPEDRERLRQASAGFNGEAASFEFRLRQANGTFRWTHERVKPWLHADGRLLGYMGSAIDVHTHKEHERRLAIIALRQTSLTHFSRLAMVQTSVEEVNREALRLFCEHLSLPGGLLFLQEEEAGPLRLAATHDLDPTSEPPLFAAGTPTGVTLDYPEDAAAFPVPEEWLAKHGWDVGVAVPVDPQAPHVGWIVGLRSEEGGPSTGMLHYAHDLAGILAITHARHRTQAKLREGEERALVVQKMEAVGLLAGGVAHDFNNLLTAIRCFAELLREDVTAPDQRMRIDDILHASSRATHLVRQLLAFSRQEMPQAEALDLNTLLDNLRGFIRSLLSEHVRIEIKPGEHPAWCQADGKLLEQVIFNLCLNARDVMPTDGVLTLSVSSGPDGPDGARRVRLSVADTGAGIPMEARGRLFQPFFSTKARGRGTGLGLATSLGIVRSFGGDLTYESTLGQGTVFFIDLPEIADPLAEYLETPAEPGERSRARIMLVEDDELVRSVTRMLAESCGHEVTSFGGSLEALAWATETRLAEIDLLVADIVMPEMNGHELSLRLREIKPTLKLLFMSGYVDDVSALRAMSQPGVFFLSKPFSSEEFTTKLAAALEAKA
ncbi:MAG: ATP-binding protein [Opitutaceae bacterium]|jgi:PAS domain S-box-containing protein